jgi:adenosine deaminase
MDPLHLARTCELHVHPGGCLTTEDLIELGKDDYKDIDWSMSTDPYVEAFGIRPDMVVLYDNALSKPESGVARFREHFVYTQEDGGDFGRFQAKFNLILSLLTHPPKREAFVKTYFERVVNRHVREGITFIEYRCSSSDDTQEGFTKFHRTHARILAAATRQGITARYIISLRRWSADQDYDWLQNLMDEHPEVIPTIVGIDFAHFEEGFPPKDKRELFERVHQDNRQNPERALEITYHVGESYFDKSLESAVRWCHEVAEMGTKRLGHATALGLDPEVAIARRPNAHAGELVSERLDQIAYDLSHSSELAKFSVQVDRKELEDEQQMLLKRSAEEIVERPYDPQRLEEVRNRQQYVLHRLIQLGTVIETCPTSNLRIGGVPDPTQHPIHTFLKSNVNLAICADDPGIFDSPLANELDWVVTHTGWTPKALAERLGDPRRFQLGSIRSA